MGTGPETFTASVSLPYVTQGADASGGGSAGFALLTTFLYPFIPFSYGPDRLFSQWY